MTGTTGNDTLIGNGGIDVIEAGAGNDTLVGGADRDWMSGEGGDDVYVYNSISDSKIGDDCDVIWGCGNGNDKIDLSKVDANSLVTGTQALQVDRRQHFLRPGRRAARLLRRDQHDRPG